MAENIIFRKATFGGFNKDDVMNYIEQLKKENAALKTAAEEKSKAYDELKEKAEAAEKELANAESKYNEYEKEAEALKQKYEAEIAELKEKSERAAELPSPQEYVGAAMMDVRRYADLLISETCEKIDDMSDKADNATARTLSRVLDISSGIQAFSDKLNAVIKDILGENDEICKELSNFKGSLKLPFSEASEQVNKNIFGEQ